MKIPIFDNERSGIYFPTQLLTYLLIDGSELKLFFPFSSAAQKRKDYAKDLTKDKDKFKVKSKGNVEPISNCLAD